VVDSDGVGFGLDALVLEWEGLEPGWGPGQECGQWIRSWDCLEFELLRVVWEMGVAGVVVWRVWGVWLCWF
jgi:hypothetical protein